MLDVIVATALWALLFLVVAVAIVVFALHRSCGKTPSAPGPPRHFLLGNLPDYLRHQGEFLELITEISKTYGRTWAIQFPFQPEWVCVTQPEEVEYVLKTNFENYEKGHDFSTRFYDLLGRGIFNVDRDLWLTQRKTAAHIFSVSNFKENMLVVFNHHCKDLMGILEKKMEGGEVIDMHDYFHRFTLDSIGEIAFGVRVGSLFGDVAYQKAFDKAQVQCFLRFLRPLWRLHPSELFHRSNVRTVREFADAVVAARQLEAKQGNLDGHHDLLSLFMAKGETDDLYLRDVINNFVIAGRDTTAQALSWGVYLISQHPDVEARLVKEVDSVFDGKSEFTLEASRAMLYTTAVMHEVLRLYPSVPKDGAYAVKDDTLPDGTRVKAGTFVAFLPFTMGRDTGLWGADAEQFDPTRWISEDGKSITKVSPYKYPVFKAGPRTCLGQSMSFLESTCVLAYLYSKFTFRMAKDAPRVHYLNSTTLPMESGLMMNVVRRTKE